MASTRQTFAFIIIFLHIISAPSFAAKSRSTPSPAAAAGPAGTENEGFPLPDTEGGKTAGTEAEVADKVTKQMQEVEKKINDFSASLKKRMEHPESSPGTKECFSECDEVLGAAVDDIKNTLDSLQSQNLMKANFDVSAVSTNVGTCNDCFDEMVGGDPEVKKLGEWVQKITGEALEALQSATTG